MKELRLFQNLNELMFVVFRKSYLRFNRKSVQTHTFSKAIFKQNSGLKMAHFFFVFLVSAGAAVTAQDLSLTPDDIRLEQRADGGFHLFIRKKSDIGSVLLTESTRDPALASDNYAYRAPEWNPINGDEIRLLDGVPISRESRVFSLIDSTPENHSELGEAFHIFIPWIVNYGYDYSRHDEVYMADGTFLNIRAFNYPYGDYRGAFHDNPFLLQAVQREVGEPEGVFMTEAERSFNEIAREGQGDFIYASDPEDLVQKINDILKTEIGKSVDIVLCMDATGSMGPYINGVRKMLIPVIRDTISEYADFRIGIVLYRDYRDDFLNKVIPFTKDFNVFQRNLNAIYPKGGGDIPEAVYEALYEGADKFPWTAESRLLILVGDAPPHPRQRGKISKEMVYEKVAEKNLKMSAILLPQ